MAFKIDDLGGLALVSLQAEDRTVFWGAVVAATTDLDLITAINALQRNQWTETGNVASAIIRAARDTLGVKEAIQELQASIPTITVRQSTTDERTASEVDVSILPGP